MRLKNDWNTDIFKPQLEILKTYAEEGRRLTEIYFGAECYFYRVLHVYSMCVPYAIHVSFFFTNPLQFTCTRR